MSRILKITVLVAGVICGGVASASEPSMSSVWSEIGARLANIKPPEKSELLISLYEKLPSHRPVDATLRYHTFLEEDLYLECGMTFTANPACAKIHEKLAACLDEFYRPLIFAMSEIEKEVEARWTGIAVALATDDPMNAAGSTGSMLVTASIEQRAAARLRREPKASCRLDAKELADPAAIEFIERVRVRQKHRAVRSLVAEEGLAMTVPPTLLTPGTQQWISDVRRLSATLSTATDYRRQILAVDSVQVAVQEADPDAVRLLRDWRDDELQKFAASILKLEGVPTKELKKSLAVAYADAMRRVADFFRRSPALAALHRQTLDATQGALPAIPEEQVSAAAETSWYRRLRGETPLAEDAELPDPPIHGCDGGGGYTLNTHDEPPKSGLPLWFFSIYEAGPRSNSTAGQGRSNEILLRIERPGRIAIAVASYDTTEWIVSVGPGVTVEKIAIIGSADSKVRGLDSVPRTHLAISDVGYEWPAISSKRAAQAAESALDAKLGSFRGCYRSEWFFVPEEPVAEEAGPGVNPYSLVGSCRESMKEGPVCVVREMSGSGITFVNLDSGAICSSAYLSRMDVDDDFASLGWSGNHLYFCSRQRGIVDIDLETSKVEIAPVACGSLTTDEKGTIYQIEEGVADRLKVYPTFEDAKADANERYVENIELYASRLAVHRGRALAAWHSTDQLLRTSLDGGGVTEKIPLTGYNDWIYGLDELDDGRLVVAAPERKGGLHIFSPTGELLKKIAIGDASGLKCRTKMN